MIEARQLTKRYGDKTVVDNLSFTVKPGEVTGFLGPNGAGKSTTMRMVVGLDSPNAGSVTVNGRSYARHPAPLHEIGSLLEAKSVHPGRTAFNHLMALAYTHGIARSRVDEVIELAGLTSVAGKRVGAFSSAWASGSASPRPCSVTRRSSCSTNRSTASTPRACCGCATSCVDWRTKAAP